MSNQKQPAGSDTSGSLRKKIAEVIRDTVMQKLNTVQQLAENNQDELDALRQRIEEQDDEIQNLKEMHAAVAGLAESEETTAEKRRCDLLVSLQRKAEGSNGMAEMDYTEVLDQWRILGHESADTDLYPKQAYRAMSKLDTWFDGVEHKDDQRPEAVRINMEDFDASTATDAFDNVNNFEEAQARQKAPAHGD